MQLQNLKCYYLADPIGTSDLTPEEEMRVHQDRLKRRGADLNIEIFPQKMYGEEFEDIKFDILFFDWGGMALGNSLMQHFLRRILKAAELKQSSLFILVSSFTHMYMEEELNAQGIKELPYNIISFEDNWEKEADYINKFFATNI